MTTACEASLSNPLRKGAVPRRGGYPDGYIFTILAYHFAIVHFTPSIRCFW